MPKKIVIGITGPFGSGKGEVVNYLSKNKDFIHFSVRDYLKKEIERRNLKLTRENLRIVANDLREKNGPGFIVEKLYEEAQKTNKNSIIESIRTTGEINTLRKKGNFYLFAVDAKPTIRYQRIKKRASETDNVTFEEFNEAEKKEENNLDPGKQNLKRCIELSDYKFVNNSTFESLYSQIDKALKDILTK